MGFHIDGLGLANPPHAIDQGDAAKQATATFGVGLQQAPLVAKLYSRSGVNTRHSVVLESSSNGATARQSFFQPASEVNKNGPTTEARMLAYESHAANLATAAAQQALSSAGVASREVTHVVTASCTGFQAPGVDLLLCQQLDLPANISRTHLGYMGCHATLNGLRVADAFARSETTNRVLFCAVELCSLHFQYGARSDQMVSNALFADGAAAVVGGGVLRDQSWAHVRATGAMRLPNSSDLMSWRIGDHGFSMSLSSRVPGVIRRELGPWVATWLAANGLTVDDINAWGIHPGGPSILDACGASIGLSPAALQPSRDVLAEFGNMSSPTVLFVLERLRRESVEGPGVLLAFGPGLAIEAVLLDMCKRSLNDT